VAKGLKVLRLFGENVHSLRLDEITAATGLSTPTVFRIVATLEQEGISSARRTATSGRQPCSTSSDPAELHGRLLDRPRVTADEISLRLGSRARATVARAPDVNNLQLTQTCIRVILRALQKS
jgi:DNA-binding MurR/RpiR family transcriptional regulator